jgi:hypothetical protein
MAKDRVTPVLHACLVLAVSGACASQDPRFDGSPTPSSLLRGVLQLRHDRPPDVRVAIAWRVPRGVEQRQRLVTQDIAVAQTWPMLFALDLAEPPPDAMRLRDGAEPPRATANVIAYRDDNHNERLDLTPLDAGALVDPLVAVAGNLTLGYVADEVTLRHIDTSARFELCDADQSPACGAIAAPITLHEVTDARTSCHLLEGLPQFVIDELASPPQRTDPWSVDLPLCPADAPPAEATRLACASGASERYVASWTAQPSAFVQNLCGPVVRICERRRDTSQPPPAGWPCPCDPTKFACEPL